METKYIKVDPSKRLPPKTNNNRPSDDWWSDSYFVITDNGKRIAYYNFESNEWMGSQRDDYTHVIYWLDEI